MLERIFAVGLLLAVLLVVPAAAEPAMESAAKAISDAESIISEMQMMKFGVTYANDTLNEARLLFAQERYMAAETVAGKISEIKQKAMDVSNLTDKVEERIYDLESKGYDVAYAQTMFDSGLAEFKTDNYAEAENTMNQALSRLDEIEAGESIKRAGTEMEANILSVLLDYLWIIIIAFLAILIVGLRAEKSYKKREAKIKIKAVEKERDVLTKNIMEIQKKYFEKGNISKTDYDMSLDKYNRDLDKIKNELSALSENHH
jgi:hypothetical protein